MLCEEGEQRKLHRYSECGQKFNELASADPSNRRLNETEGKNI